MFLKEGVLAMSEQDGAQATAMQRPANEDREGWKAYWREQGQAWRTEPEIDEERQRFLAERREIKPDIEQGIYPFRGIKLNRADVEWLLATHEGGRGPVDWGDEGQRKREGLDLRGADLQGVDLRLLPLARLRGGLNREEWERATEEQRKGAGVVMNRADLKEALLQGADLRWAQLDEIRLVGAQLEKACLRRVQLERANLYQAQLQGVDLRWAQLQGASMVEANLQGTNLRWAHLDGSDLAEVTLSDRNHVGPLVDNVHWGNTNLAIVDWSEVEMLGDEYEARQKEENGGRKKGRHIKLLEYRAAARANRQLAVVLRDQGMNGEADYFAYHAQVLQRIVLRLQGLQPEVTFWRRVRKLSFYVFLGFLDLLAGYGYIPLKTVVWYLLVVAGFATAYSFFGHLPPIPDALVFSFMSFHGRGFFPNLSSASSLHNPLVVIAAAEAVTGLFIEISFIATFTQRFFAR